MNKLILYERKILKLTNVLKYEVTNSDCNIELIIEKMSNYIKVKGSLQIGPLIQYMRLNLDEQKSTSVNVELMLQTKDYINTVDMPYKMESLIKIPNCMYCRYVGPENKVKLAYDKIQLTAFEKEIPLTGKSYTIFIDKNEENEIIVVDVFMERAD